MNKGREGNKKDKDEEEGEEKKYIQGNKQVVYLILDWVL